MGVSGQVYLDMVAGESPNKSNCEPRRDRRREASRFNSLRAEAARLGGVPVFAVLSGLGWRRARDALGPVVRDTDGRIFTIANLSEMLSADPFPQLVASAT
jgi:hypothetical protein